MITNPLPRPSVRVVCLDASERVLLLQWQDPVTGELLWEPPGGGIERGESPFDAARRELFEETGLDADAVLPASIIVARNTTWKGQRYVGEEPFFLARFWSESPELTRIHLVEDEHSNLVTARWYRTEDFEGLEGRLEPANLRSVILQLQELPGKPNRPRLN